MKGMPLAFAGTCLLVAAVQAWGLTAADVAERLKSDFHQGLYARTYNSLLERVEAEGFFQESLTGAYAGMFPRTVGGLA